MSIADKFNIPPALFETIKKMNAEETEYQAKVKALMKKKGITSLGQLSPEEKKDFFNTLDSMHKAKNEEVELEEAIPKSTGHALVHSSSRKIVAKGNKAEMMKKMKELNAKEKNSHHLGMTNRGKVGDTFGEEVELEEGKSGTGYELYHKDFSSAMAHAYDFAKNKYNIEIDPLEIDRNVAMGPKKPSSGKANAYRLLDKTGKKAIQVQVTNLDNKRYELNMYKEDVDLTEVAASKALQKAHDDERKRRGLPDPSYYLKLAAQKKKEIEDMKKEKKEEVELEEVKVPNCVPVKEGYGNHPSQRVDPRTGKKYVPPKSPLGQGVAERQETERLKPPFTPDKPKKQAVAGKYGSGPSIAKHLAKMAMKKQQEKKPVKEEIELDEGMSATQIDKLRQEYDKLKGIDPASDNYKKLTGMLDKLDTKTLQQLAGAKIKFVSGLAQNRVVRRMNEEVEVLDEDLMTLGPVSRALVGAAMGLGMTLVAIDFWFGSDPDRRKPIERGLDKAEKDGNAKLYHSLAAKYYQDIADDYKKKLQKLRTNPQAFYKKDSAKSGAKAGDMKKFYQEAEKEYLHRISWAEKKEKMFSEREKSGAPIARGTYYWESVKHSLTHIVEEVELNESHFKVGQRVECIKSGMKGTVVKKDTPEEGKYYTVKQDSGKMMKYAPDELKALSTNEAKEEGASKKKENEFHKNLDKLVHKTFGKSSDEKKMKEEVEVDELRDPRTSMKRAALSVARAKEVGRHQNEIGKIRRKREALRNSFDAEESIDEEKKKVLWPGTPEYKKKFPKESKPGQRHSKQDYGYRGKSGADDEEGTKKESYDYSKLFVEAVKKNKKEATAKESSKNLKKGDQLSGKQEPVEIHPELKEEKS